MDADINTLEMMLHELGDDNPNKLNESTIVNDNDSNTKNNKLKGLSLLPTTDFNEFKMSYSDENGQTEYSKENNHLEITPTNNLDTSPTNNIDNNKHKPVISSMFDDDYNNHIDIEELNDRDQSKMIQKQKEYEKYGKCACGYKLFRTIWSLRIIIFNVMFLFIGLGISEYIVDNILDKTALSWRIWFYTIYFSILIFCISLTKLILFLLMRILYKMTKDSWKVFYIKNINKRLYMTILSILWLLNFYIFGGLTDYDYNQSIWAFIQCICITSIIFLVTHLFIRYIALNSYFGIFKQKARKLKAYNTFIEIMLNKTDSLFCMPIMNFLIDFPSYDDINKSAKNSGKTASFKFQIHPSKADKNKITEMALKVNKEYENIKTNDEIRSLLDTPICSINLQKAGHVGAFKLIKEQTLDRLAHAISYLIMVKLNDIKNVILKNSKGHESNLTQTIVSNTFRMRTFDIGKLELLNVNNNDKINRDVFIKIFEQYPKPNKNLLIDLGELAWKKFKDKDSEYLNADVLNMNIRQIIHDLLQLKQSVDSYIVIINNLQTLIDIMTPILLLFVYLYIFDFDLEETITLYVSSVGIIGFFGSSYFSTVFSSISFILALNPFLVGDYIMYDMVVYRVEEIALISCVFRQMANGYSYTFQNRELGKSSHPIVNFSRSDKTKYKWTFYFKPCDLTVQDIYDFNDKVKQKIKERRDYELKNIKKSYCTYSELKSINYKSIKTKCYELDEFGRKKIKVQMKYVEYCNDVQNICFNCVTQVMKELGYEMEPLKIIKQKVEVQQGI